MEEEDGFIRWGALLVWGNNTREERDLTVLRLQDGMPAKPQVKKWALFEKETLMLVALSLLSKSVSMQPGEMVCGSPDSPDVQLHSPSRQGFSLPALLNQCGGEG